MFPPIREDNNNIQKEVFEYFKSSFTDKFKNDFRVFKYQNLFADLFQVYPKFLLISEPGTGKSITFIEACEKAIVKNVFIFERNKIMVNNIISEIYNSTIKPFEIKEEEKTIKTIKSIIKKNYTVTTYTKFFNKNVNLQANELKDLYFNSIFVFDEIHKLIGNTEYNKELNFFYYLFSLFDPKLILVSATPITTEKEQIIPYMKLLNLKEPSNYSSKTIKNTFLGYTSFVEIQKNDTVKRVFIEKKPKNVKIETNLYFSEMKGTQLKSYKFYDLPQNRGSYRSNIIQAAAFVFPDGSIGGIINSSSSKEEDNIDPDEEMIYSESFKDTKKGLSKYVEDLSRDYKIPGIYQFKNTFKKSENEDLQNLSTKMNSILKIERDNENTPGTVFIYTGNMKNGGGSIILSLILEKYGGYTNFLKTGKLSSKTYVTLNTEMTENEKKRILDIFNSKENATGNKIRIIIGTSQLKEGISFFNCVRVHLLNRAWTYAEDFQSISRALRTNSHKYLLEYLNGKNIIVSIFKHASYYTEKGNFYSVDYEIEKINEERQPELDEIMKGLKEAAIDTLFFKNEITTKEEISFIQEKEKEEDDYYFINKDSFFKVLSKIDYPDNIMKKNNEIEKKCNDSNYIIKSKRDIYNKFLYKNSINIFGKFEQYFINRNRLYRNYQNDRWNYSFFNFVYDNMYSKNIFSLVNNFLNEDKVLKTNINKKNVIEDFYEKTKKDIFGVITESGILKIIIKSNKENNKGKNSYSFSKEELNNLYNKLIRKSKKIESKEFYTEEFISYFKKNNLLLKV